MASAPVAPAPRQVILLESSCQTPTLSLSCFCGPSPRYKRTLGSSSRLAAPGRWACRVQLGPQSRPCERQPQWVAASRPRIFWTATRPRLWHPALSPRPRTSCLSAHAKNKPTQKTPCRYAPTVAPGARGPSRRDMGESATIHAAAATAMCESLSDMGQLTARRPRSSKSGSQISNMRREYSDSRHLEMSSLPQSLCARRTETWPPDHRASPSPWATTATSLPTSAPPMLPLPLAASSMPSQAPSSMRPRETASPTRLRPPPARTPKTALSSMRLPRPTSPTRPSLSQTPTSRPLCDTPLSLPTLRPPSLSIQPCQMSPRPLLPIRPCRRRPSRSLNTPPCPKHLKHPQRSSARSHHRQSAVTRRFRTTVARLHTLAL